MSVGELLWDLLPDGRQLGGAPANFGYHVRALGATARLVSRVGNDQDGRDIMRQLRTLGLPVDLVQVDDVAHTGLVTVQLVGAGVPQYTIHEPAAWDNLQLPAAALETARSADVICFGSLAQRLNDSRQTVQKLVTSTPPEALRIFDVNLRQPYYSRNIVLQSLELANVLKLNESELTVLADLLELEPDLNSQVEDLAARFDLRAVAVTCGPTGSILFQDGRWSRREARPVRVRDTVGAGDAFTAGLAMGLLWRMGLDEIHDLATEIASYVCTQAGATPPLPASLLQRYAPARTLAPRSSRRDDPTRDRGRL